MKSARNIFPQILTATFLVASADDAVAVEYCPTEQLVFRDDASRREFVAERVALNFKWNCNGKIVSDDRERPDLKGKCRGPYGDTIIEGHMAGQKVYAVYSINDGSPCCTWDSYPGTNAQVPAKIKRWLPSGAGPKISMTSKWFVIQDIPPASVAGPLGGGIFEIFGCQKR